MKYLNKVIKRGDINALNQDERHPIQNVFLYETHFYLQSDADDQLIINLPLSSFIEFTQLNLSCLEEGKVPSLIKVFVNNPSMDFDDCEGKKGVNCSISGLGEKGSILVEIKDKGCRRVDCVTIFIESSTGGDISAINKIDLYGRQIEHTEMKELKRVG